MLHAVEEYTDAASQKPDYHSGLPIWQLRKIQDYVSEQLAEEISVEAGKPASGNVGSLPDTGILGQPRTTHRGFAPASPGQKRATNA